MTVDTTTNQLPVTWIIGATGGIGAALARRLAPKAQLVLSARNEAPLTALASELGAQACTVDATQPESIQQALTNVLQIYGRIDAVVLAVGSILLKSAHRTSLDEWHTTITQNLHAAFYVVRAVTDKMQRQPDGGSILLFSTAAAQIGFANHEAIAAAKAGVEGLARATAASYAPRNIRVNVIAPGLVDTPLAHPITSNATALEASRQMHPLGRIGVADDVAHIAEAVLTSTWMTGQVVVVDGGLSGVKK
jgi:NAD(P)-dependent dehydrogenase (short-subunit alcohol dehydrogenase family)